VVSAWFLFLLAGLGLTAVAARRPAVAAVLIAAQTLLVGAGALAVAPGRSHEFAVAAALLLVKGLAVSAILAVAVVRVREARPHDEELGMVGRLGGAVALVLVVAALVPAYGLESRAAEHAAAAMVATALALVLVRRATAFAVLAVLIAENGIAVAAISVGGALPLVVELGIAFDLVLVIVVATAFQRRILSAFGTTDSAALREIRD
jgi:hydrogenase-4 component E